MKAAAAGTDEIIRLKHTRREEGQRQNAGKYLLLFRVGGGQGPKKELSARRTRSVVPEREEGFRKVASRLAEEMLGRARTETTWGFRLTTCKRTDSIEK